MKNVYGLLVFSIAAIIGFRFTEDTVKPNNNALRVSEIADNTTIPLMKKIHMN